MYRVAYTVLTGGVHFMEQNWNMRPRDAICG